MRMNAPDGRGVTFLIANGAAQGAQADSGERLVYDYNRYYRLEQIFCPSMQRAVFLGAGAYSMPQALSDDHPEAVIDVVEIDPKIEQIGHQFFRLDEYQGRVRPVTADARGFLSATSARYDLIFGDVFRGRQTVPPHLATREFFDLVKRRLTDDGVYMMNVVGALEGRRSRFFTSVLATLREVFPHVRVFVVYPRLVRTQPQNLVLVAPNRDLRWSKADLLERAGNDELGKMVAHLLEPDAVDLASSTLLTDDFCPVEYLVADQLRE